MCINLYIVYKLINIYLMCQNDSLSIVAGKARNTQCNVAKALSKAH
jgi:hypothetical protein